MGAAVHSTIAWQPQAGPQKALVDCPVYEVFYGGARGGGKTDGVLGKYALKALRFGKGFNALFCRRELPMLDDAIARAQEIYPKIGADWNEQKKQWIFPGGGRLRFRPLERIQDADKYQGQNVSDVCVEEAGQYPDPAPIFRMNAVLRSARGVPTQLILTGNPGGAGQFWLRERYVDPAPRGFKLLEESFKFWGKEYKRKRVYIPSSLRDNPLLLMNDPMYIANLHMVGSEALVNAWLNGDWNSIEGAFFDCWSDQMIIRPFSIPEHWVRFRSFDWGYAKPFSCGWWAVAGEDAQCSTGTIPKGSIVRYREWYGKTGVNTGLRLDAEEVGKGIADRTLEKIDYSVADPAIFSQDGGPSIFERMLPFVTFQRADNSRVGAKGFLGGWDQMRSRMRGDERPHIYCFDTCTDSIRTIPLLQHDPVRAEDLDTSSEDHAADEWRYACMSRPFVREAERTRGGITTRMPTFNELMKELERSRIDSE